MGINGRGIPGLQEGESSKNATNVGLLQCSEVSFTEANKARLLDLKLKASKASISITELCNEMSEKENSLTLKEITKNNVEVENGCNSGEEPSKFLVEDIIKGDGEKKKCTIKARNTSRVERRNSARLPGWRKIFF